RCPRLLAWFRVLMMVSLVKHPASAGLLSRIGDYLLLQHEGLGSDKNITDSAWPGRHQRRPGSIGTMTRSPPQPLFHRRRNNNSNERRTQMNQLSRLFFVVIAVLVGMVIAVPRSYAGPTLYQTGFED